jgi:hypothetical protein
MLIDSLVHNSSLKLIWIIIFIRSIITSFPFWNLCILIVVLIVRLHLKRSIRDIMVCFEAMISLYHLKRCIYILEIALIIANSAIIILE